MKLSSAQIDKYNKNGFLVIENVFDAGTIRLMLKEMKDIIEEDCPRRILEKSGAVRSFFAPETSSLVFNNIVKDQRLLQPAKQLLGSSIYVHQTKLNTKHALVGDWWDWHQDFTFWHKDDGMPLPHVLTAMIFMNDVTDFNGPMFLVPGSQQEGMAIPEEKPQDQFSEYCNSTTYMSALTADLKYTLGKESICRWVEKNGMTAAKGPAGSVLFFHGNIFHASANNLSPWDRHTFLVTYNSVNNTLEDIPDPRPAFIANRNFSPLA